MEKYIELSTVKTFRYNPITKQYYWVKPNKTEKPDKPVNDFPPLRL